MTVLKTALAASAILATLGLAGCQTTEERVYYSPTPTAVSEAYVYEGGTYVRRRPPPVYVVQPTPRYWGGAPRAYEGPPRHPRFDGGPPPERRWDRPHRPPVASAPFNPGAGHRQPPRREPGPVTHRSTPDPRFYPTR